MNQKLQNIFDIIQQSDRLDIEQKDSLLKAVKDADKELEITAFKLERTEKVKKTTAILLEETIEELEQKRKAVEAQNHELEIETALEKVRTIAMAMRKPDDMLDVCKTISQQLESLGVKEIRNVQTAIFYEQRGTYMNYEYYAKHDKTFITETTYTNNEIHNEFATKMLKGKGENFITHIKGDEVKDWIEYQKTTNVFIDKYLGTASSLNYYWFSLGLVALGISTYIPLTEDDINLFKRFLKVFELAFQRYLDIEKAEAQAREAEIQLALERVRSRTMAMHKSDELLEAGELLYREITRLGIVCLTSGYVLMDEKENIGWNYAASPKDGKIMSVPVGIPHLETEVMRTVTTSWKKGEPYSIIQLDPEATIKHQTFIAERSTNFPLTAKELIAISPEQVVLHNFNFKHGYLLIVGGVILTAEQIDMMVRFSKVFEMTYRRFLDLKQAEAQAREAEIQLALERVRARSLAMHNTSELQEVVNILAQQLYNMNLDINGGVFIVINDEVDKDIPLWASGGAAEYVQKVSVPFLNKPVFTELRDAIKRKNNFFTEEHSQDEKIGLFEHLFNYAPWNSHSQQRKQELLSREGGYTRSVAISQHTSISITNHNGKKFSDDDNEILKRFGSVFEQSYIRFLDLQKAEAQAREAQIEAALEKVRSRSLAMHATNELGDVVTVIVEKLKDLGVVLDANGVVLCTYFRESKDVLHWIASPDFSFAGSYLLPYFDHPIFNDAWESKESGVEYFSKAYSVEEKNSFFEYVFKHSDYKQFPDDFKQWIFQNDKHILSFAWQKNSAILIPSHTGVLPSVDDVAILKRFAKVFEQSYVRFLDLQKAEAQAREARIEASLERVRSKSMAMHTPNDLTETVSLFFKELKSLNVLPWRCGVGRIDEATRTTYLTTTSITKDGQIIEVAGKLKQTGHPVLDGIFDNWKLQKEYFPVLRGDDINQYYSIIKPQISYPDYPLDAVQYGHTIQFKEGFIFAWTENRLSEDELQIFRRFSSVLSLTYRRFIDLKEAEARAVEVVKQASLDRVRAEIASMRTAEDLNRITPIIWRELKTLEVPFIRCGVFIIDEYQAKVHVYLSSPDGKSLGALNLPFEFSALTSNSVQCWRKKEVYKEHWSKEQFIRWTQSMIEQHQVQNAQIYQGSSDPPESLNLHFVPFTQGMLYVGDILPLSEEKLQLVKSLAEGFSIAYARYEDFKNLEDAKNRVESTLKELKSAQAQLIHSEKMASLGELTAGIAHEIKNPLNFVNNFSELSQELLEDLKEELENSNKEEVMAIVNDVKQNLEKINQHGKRADSIVKGMLLHSRGTSGEKTLTDLNNLLDQYVTLAYHGLRAQDKEFNITIEKDFDETVGKINVVPQDISRVFLNIINNACYAAYDKKKKNSDDNFSPTLKVSTNNLEEKIEIRIRDNGNGIPIEIRDKLFNPFFTTKPTGEGTGLGLSLSYDIVVKQHSGEIKFESEEGNYTEFTITLPQK